MEQYKTVLEGGTGEIVENRRVWTIRKLFFYLFQGDDGKIFQQLFGKIKTGKGKKINCRRKMGYGDHCSDGGLRKQRNLPTGL